MSIDEFYRMGLQDMILGVHLGPGQIIMRERVSFTW